MIIFADKQTHNQAENTEFKDWGTLLSSVDSRRAGQYFTIFTHTLLRDQGFNSYVMYSTVLYCTELYCTVPYCTVQYTLLYSIAQKLLLSRSIYVAIHSNNVFLRFITVNYLELRTRGEQRRMWRQMIKFADMQSSK